MTDFKNSFNISNRLLLFMDLLGVKKIIENEPEKILYLLSIINFYSSIQRSECIAYTQNDKIFDIKKFEPEISNFSDHIVISFSTSDNIVPYSSGCAFSSLVGIAAQLHRHALNLGILARGAIVEGHLYHKGNSVIGKALLCALDLERRVKFPVVAISKEIFNKFSGSISEHLIEKDSNTECYFLNHLDHPAFTQIKGPINKALIVELCDIKENIEEGLSKYKHDLDVYKKWSWLSEKFNKYLIFSGNRYPSIKKEINMIDRINVQFLSCDES